MVNAEDGKVYELSFERGAVTKPLHVCGETDITGTIVTFKPDPQIFSELEFDYDILLTRLREQAFLNGGIKMTLRDARDTEEVKEKVMCYEGGITAFVAHLNRNKTSLHQTVIYLSSVKDSLMAEVAIQYNDSYNENLLSFANNIHTSEGGMHETGFKSGLTKVLNDYARKHG